MYMYLYNIDTYIYLQTFCIKLIFVRLTGGSLYFTNKCVLGMAHVMLQGE